MAKGKFTSSSGTALIVEATQNASAVLITSDAANAMEVDSSSDVMTISVTNLDWAPALPQAVTQVRVCLRQVMKV